LQKFPQTVTQLSNLQQLHLDNNQIRSLPLTVKNLTKLEQLWLGGNSLRQLPIELGQLTSLTELHLGRNLIYQVPSELSNLKNLVSLNLSYNHLTDIPPQILDLRQLETLNLEGNTRNEIVTDFGKLLTYREQLEQAVERAEVLRQEAVGARELAEIAQEQAENANRVKGQFLSQMSHELRTPMNGVIGSLDLIDQQTLNPEQIQHIERAKNSGQHLLTVINEILQFSELETGQITYQPDPFDLVQTCQQVLEILLPLSQQKGIQLNLDYPLMISGGWLGDQQKIKQVILNLVANAIKFTIVGEVKLKLSTTSNGIRVGITDTGIGIAEDQIENIFESFTQASQGHSRKFGGTGLGLSISHRFVEGMGGKIGVESQLGQGSTFWFELPLEGTDLPDQQPEVKTVEPTDLSAKRGLVVDDDLINRVIARKHLENLGCQVDEAVDGQDCLTQYQQNQYDLILMDLQMPEVDGFQASQQIRQLEQSSGLKRVVIVALTASVVGEVWERCQSAGMDGYVGKPFQVEELKQKLQELMFS
jgi:signal transduction histidine kinase/CheY-like chemotaxis protein